MNENEMREAVRLFGPKILELREKLHAVWVSWIESVPNDTDRALVLAASIGALEQYAKILVSSYQDSMAKDQQSRNSVLN